MKYQKVCKIYNEYVKPYIEKAIIRYSQRTQRNIEQKTEKATKCVALNEFADGTQNMEALQSHSMGFLLAGRDNTSKLLSWAVSTFLIITVS